MNCKKPFVKSGSAYGCGQCLPCRINKRRIWTSRIMLEAKDNEENAFVTLTYSDDKVPPLGSLDPSHSRDFLKRLRAKMEPKRFRYYLVGEYGDQTERPHYHAALFGYPQCLYGRSIYSKSRLKCCEACDTIKSTWGHGLIYSGDLTPESASYIAGYVTKKLTSKNDERLHGRYPEFARMSRRPGIGAPIMHELADGLLLFTDNQGRYTGNDVPSELRSGNKTYPLGRYLRRKLRTYVGLPENAPQKTLDQMAETLRPLRELAYSYAPPGQKAFTYQQALITASQGKRTNIEAKFRRYKKRETL